MIQFKRLSPDHREEYEQYLMTGPTRGCEYSFANKYLWGKQQAAYLHGCVAFFSHFHGKSIYTYPIGSGDRKAVIEDILQDARERGIPCRISGLTDGDREELESWFPGMFRLRTVRDDFDYVYDINDLADLRGRKFQKKRNHVNRFHTEHPDFQVVPLGGENLLFAREMVADWYADRKISDPNGDYLLESIAIGRAFDHYGALHMEGIALVEDDRVLAVTMGSPLSPDTFDIHFEKAREDVDGAYAAVNCEFARYLRLKYPEIQFLNREDDLGLEGLRKAKLSYNPHHLLEKHRATRLEDLYED